MARSPVKSRDRMLTRRKLVLVAMMACASAQTKMMLDAIVFAGAESVGGDQTASFAANLMHSQLAYGTQLAVLVSALAPLLRPKTRYRIGPQRYSFERLGREFGDTTSTEAEFRFELPHLSRLCTALKFPPVMHTRSRFLTTGEEVFLYTLRRLSYPCKLSSLAWESGRSISAQSEIFDLGITHIYRTFTHLRDGRSLECWARHFQRFAVAIHRGGRKGSIPLPASSQRRRGQAHAEAPLPRVRVVRSRHWPAGCSSCVRRSRASHACDLGA